MVNQMAPKRELKRNARLFKLREKLGLTQTEMSVKLGVTLRAYQNYEANRAIPKPVAILVRLLESGDYKS